MLAYCKASPSQFLQRKYVQQKGPPLQRFAAFERRNRAPVVLRGQHSADIMLLEEKKELVANSIRGVPDFPKKGIMFWDITTLCLDPAAFRCCIEAFAERYRDQKIDVIAGSRARLCLHDDRLSAKLKNLPSSICSHVLLQALRPGALFLALHWRSNLTVHLCPCASLESSQASQYLHTHLAPW